MDIDREDVVDVSLREVSLREDDCESVEQLDSERVSLVSVEEEEVDDVDELDEVNDN